MIHWPNYPWVVCHVISWQYYPSINLSRDQLARLSSDQICHVTNCQGYPWIINQSINQSTLFRNITSIYKFCFCWSKNYFAHFSTQTFHYTFIMISIKKYGEKKKKFPRLVSMEMAAIFDFRALTKVHLTSKPLLQMQ